MSIDAQVSGRACAPPVVFAASLEEYASVDPTDKSGDKDALLLISAQLTKLLVRVDSPDHVFRG
jgi:hypothetical protein